MLKNMDFYHFLKKSFKKLFDTGLDTSKKVVRKVDECLQNKTADAVTKSNADNIEKREPVGEIIPPEKKEILNKLRKVL